jgi:hypothetical protein
VGVVLAVELAYQATEPDQDGVDDALMDGTDLDP